MGAAESTIVLLPRFTTLCGTSLKTQPLDVSQFASAQIQVWRGPEANPQLPTTMKVYFEESLDCEKWTLGAAAPRAVIIAAERSKFFSYGFRLRWFRLRIEFSTSQGPGGSAVTCWAEGILR